MTERPGAARALAPGSTIGILGGGQLGRMLSIAAARLGLRTHIYEPGPEPPAGDVAAAVTTAPWDDPVALDAFAAAVDVVTLEFENVPVATVGRLERSVPVRPGRRALEIAQDRVAEKAFANELGIATCAWAAVDELAGLGAALGRVGTPALLKTRRLGYDGKGQARIERPAEADAAWEAIAGAPAILEGLVAFESEISVIAARDPGGRVVCFEPGRNEHRQGILRRTTVPAGVPEQVRAGAMRLAGRVLEALDYVGVMGVEFFVTAGDELLLNEVAPRVHNSGHWTIEGCVVDQFQQHIRAVAGWPLGDGARHSDAEMTNLIGADAEDWQALAAEGGAGLHLYGKREARPGRKMGHLTRLKPPRD